MLQAVTKCPHCSNEGTFDFYAVPYVEHVKFTNLPGGKQVEVVRIRGIASCCKCREPTLIEAEIFRNEWEVFKNYIDKREVYRIQQFRITRKFPEPKEPYSHPSIPEKIRKLFSDVQKLLKTAETPALVVGACRSVLDAATKELGAREGNLYERIEELYKQHIITEPVKEWAHILRRYGNKAIHEIEASYEDAEELVEFTKLFLIITFELPARINEKKRSG